MNTWWIRVGLNEKNYEHVSVSAKVFTALHKHGFIDSYGNWIQHGQLWMVFWEEYARRKH